MPKQRPFRFGVQCSRTADATQWRALARRIEEQGYTSLFLPDHFGDQFAPIPAMVAAAEAAPALRVGALVFDNDYKHPVVMAKEIATIDVLTGGRVEFGLGAGWMTSDYEQSGIPHDPPAVRVDRFEEAITVFKGLFADGPFSFEGTHYQINGLDGTPKPVQKPGPPLLIGGGGKRVLSIAGREADIIGINPNMKAGVVSAEAGRDGGPDRIDEKIQWVKDAAGDRFDDIELNALVYVGVVTDDRDAFAERLAPAFGLTPESAMDVPSAWFGTVEQICDKLVEWRERWGFSYFVVQKDAAEPMAPVVAKLAGT